MQDACTAVQIGQVLCISRSNLPSFVHCINRDCLASSHEQAKHDANSRVLEVYIEKARALAAGALTFGKNVSEALGRQRVGGCQWLDYCPPTSHMQTKMTKGPKTYTAAETLLSKPDRWAR